MSHILTAAVRLFALLLAAMLLPVSPQAQEQSVFPGVNRPYLAPDIDIDRWTGILEAESREIFIHRERIVEALGLKPGMTVADVGAGTGLFVAHFASSVGADGRVFAVEIVPKFAEHIRDRSAEAALPNVTVVLSQERSITLPHGSTDLVFLCDVYHHFEYPNAVLASIREALRPSGELVVIDFHRIPGVSDADMMRHVRADQQTFTREIEAAGFDLVEEVAIEGLKENYVLRFRRK
jgi:ubiquinone/menaquinone biosynthesis C-methylase UbiE